MPTWSDMMLGKAKRSMNKHASFPSVCSQSIPEPPNLSMNRRTPRPPVTRIAHSVSANWNMMELCQFSKAMLEGIDKQVALSFLVARNSSFEPSPGLPC